ncbi:aat family amino acid transporter [Diplodia corticola]|uniref:Aat family amino acid transporter n=1 Tax=Diplodia corticola TaxID=236234 RepID=A0A1J9R2Z7_9PEZI|nr:aat family amino acid transporter [Diplodia corticola]OJD34602.1 aat family amino acid transporter [Diplodia corticola]
MSSPPADAGALPDKSSQDSLSKFPIDEKEGGDVIRIPQTAQAAYKGIFSPRRMQVIALGGSIGSGLFITTGRGLSTGGPAGFVFGYGFVAILVWCVLQLLTEMTIAFPVSGNLFEYADRWVDPALAFAAGFAEWLGWTAVCAAEATMFTVLINYWAENRVHDAVWLSIFLVVVFGLFFLPSKAFAWFEYVTSLVKVTAFLTIFWSSVAIMAGGGPTGRVHTGETWRDYPKFKNGFAGIGQCMMLACWAYGDQVFIGIMGGEAFFPRLAMGRACKMVTGRMFVIYMTSIMWISLLVPSDDDRLYGSSGAAASPFIISMQDAGITGLPHFLNGVIVVGVTAIACESIYIASRTLRSLAAQGLIPKFMATVDARGRPRGALVVTSVVAVTLTYINLSSGGVTIFTWFTSITSSSFFCVWIILVIVSWRFRAALKAQNDPLFDQVYSWSASFYYFTLAWLALGCALLTAACIYVGLYPVDGGGLSVESFFQYVLGLILILTSYLGYKVVFRTKIRDVKTVDLVSDRRPLTEDDIMELDAYYKQGIYRRFASYFTIW